MGEDRRTALEMRLSAHYAAAHTQTTPGTIDALAASMVREHARASRTSAHGLGFAAFVAAQVRYVPGWTWVAQAALVALMCIMAQTSTSADATKAIVGVLSATSVLVGVPTVQASKRYGVVELEYACPYNALSVLVARLIALGCSSSLVVACMVGLVAASLDLSAFSVALWACPPFFCSCAGSLALLRRATPQAGSTLCAVWTITCSSALIAAARMLPDLYAASSLTVWATAAAAALAWLARELIATMRAVAAGLDAFSPHAVRVFD